MNTHKESTLLPQTLFFCCYHFFPLSFLHSFSEEESSYVFRKKGLLSLPNHNREMDSKFVEIPEKRWKRPHWEARRGRCVRGSETCLPSETATRCHSFRDLDEELPLTPSSESFLHSGAHTSQNTVFGFLRTIKSDQILWVCSGFL